MKPFVHRIQEKGAVTPQETDTDLPVNVQESPVEAWISSGLLKVGGTECSSACMGPFERGQRYLKLPPQEFGLKVK